MGYAYEHSTTSTCFPHKPKIFDFGRTYSTPHAGTCFVCVRNTPTGYFSSARNTPYGQEKIPPTGYFRTKKIPPMGVFFHAHGIFSSKKIPPMPVFSSKKIPPMELRFSQILTKNLRFLVKIRISFSSSILLDFARFSSWIFQLVVVKYIKNRNLGFFQDFQISLKNGLFFIDFKIFLSIHHRPLKSRIRDGNWKLKFKIEDFKF